MATVIVLVGCYYGYNASGGPVGVGTATAKSMVLNTVMVHLVGMVGTQIFWGSNPTGADRRMTLLPRHPRAGSRPGACAYAVGRGMEDSGLATALFLALAAAAWSSAPRASLPAAPTAEVTLLIGLPSMLLAAGAYAGRRRRRVGS